MYPIFIWAFRYIIALAKCALLSLYISELAIVFLVKCLLNAELMTGKENIALSHIAFGYQSITFFLTYVRMRYFAIQNMVYVLYGICLIWYVYVLYDIPAVVNQCKPESIIPTHAL